ncbi:MAG: polysaccharide biosynthesis protein, partial [Carnobacterium sp.]
MSRTIKKSVLVLFDSLAIILSSIVAYIFLNPYIELPFNNLFLKTVLTIMIYLVLAVYFKSFSKINRYTSIKESFALIGSVTTAFILSGSILILIKQPFSMRYALLGYIFSSSLIVGSRIIWRIYNEHHYRRMHL